MLLLKMLGLFLFLLMKYLFVFCFWIIILSNYSIVERWCKDLKFVWMWLWFFLVCLCFVNWCFVFLCFFLICGCLFLWFGLSSNVWKYLMSLTWFDSWWIRARRLFFEVFCWFLWLLLMILCLVINDDGKVCVFFLNFFCDSVMFINFVNWVAYRIWFRWRV